MDLDDQRIVVLLDQNGFDATRITTLSLPHPRHGAPVKFALVQASTGIVPALYELQSLPVSSKAGSSSMGFSSWILGNSLFQGNQYVYTASLVHPLFLLIRGLRKSRQLKKTDANLGFRGVFCDLSSILFNCGAGELLKLEEVLGSSLTKAIEDVCDISPSGDAYRLNDELLRKWIKDRVERVHKVLQNFNEFQNDADRIREAVGIVCEYLDEDSIAEICSVYQLNEKELCRSHPITLDEETAATKPFTNASFAMNAKRITDVPPSSDARAKKPKSRKKDTGKAVPGNSSLFQFFGKGP